jgi:hypothetical protein
MDSVEALDFATIRLKRSLATLQRLRNDPRRDRQQTDNDIEEYTATIETLTALRDLIAENVQRYA